MMIIHVLPSGIWVLFALADTMRTLVVAGLNFFVDRDTTHAVMLPSGFAAVALPYARSPFIDF